MMSVFGPMISAFRATKRAFRASMSAHVLYRAALSRRSFTLGIQPQLFRLFRSSLWQAKGRTPCFAHEWPCFVDSLFMDRSPLMGRGPVRGPP
eukprot:scaffold10568_cov70-Phaeocystis_antarctica.AAC.1